MAERRTRKTSRKRNHDLAAVVTTEVRPSSPLRGLLPTPSEVAKLVAREVKERPMTREARQWVEDCFKLQYYFGGHEIAYRKTRDGVEVLAAGLEEIGKLLRNLPYSQHKGIVIGHPEPW